MSVSSSLPLQGLHNCSPLNAVAMADRPPCTLPRCAIPCDWAAAEVSDLDLPLHLRQRARQTNTPKQQIERHPAAVGRLVDGSVLAVSFPQAVATYDWQLWRRGGA